MNFPLLTVSAQQREEPVCGRIPPPGLFRANISAIRRETKKLMLFPKGPTWPKILYLKPRLSSIQYQKEFLKYINSKEYIELSKVLQKHQSSIIYSFIFIHFLMSENDKNVPLIVCDFHTK